MINSKVAPWCTRPLLLGVAALLVACNEGGGNDDDTRIAVAKKTRGSDVRKISTEQAQSLQGAGAQVAATRCYGLAPRDGSSPSPEPEPHGVTLAISPIHLYVHEVHPRDVAAAEAQGYTRDISLQGYEQLDCQQPIVWVEELPDASTEPINPQALQAAGFVTLGSGLPLARDKIPESGNAVFRTATEWQAAWAGNQAGGGAAEPLPEVDFGKYMVAGIDRVLGTGCEDAGIAKVEQSATALTVHTWFAGPPRGAVCTAMVSRINRFVLLPQSTLPVQFAEHPLQAISPSWSWPLQLQATVSEDRTVKTGGSTVCTPLVTTFAVRGGEGFPQQFKVNAVAVAQDGVTRWLQPASASETGIAQRLVTDSHWLNDAAPGTPDSKSEPILRGVARGCTSPQFKLGEPVTVLLSVAAADGQAELVATSSLNALVAVAN